MERLGSDAWLSFVSIQSPSTCISFFNHFCFLSFQVCRERVLIYKNEFKAILIYYYILKEYFEFIMNLFKYNRVYVRGEGELGCELCCFLKVLPRSSREGLWVRWSQALISCAHALLLLLLLLFIASSCVYPITPIPLMPFFFPFFYFLYVLGLNDSTRLNFHYSTSSMILSVWI